MDVDNVFIPSAEGCMATLTCDKQAKDKQAHDKQADLAGPGIGNYTELESLLPTGYRSLLDRRDTQKRFSRPSGTSKTISVKRSI
jgi:hypothetical protein